MRWGAAAEEEADTHSQEPRISRMPPARAELLWMLWMQEVEPPEVVHTWKREA